MSATTGKIVRVCESCGRELTQEDLNFWGECPCLSGPGTTPGHGRSAHRSFPIQHSEIQYHGGRFHTGEW